MQKLLVIGHTWPESKTTAAGNRMMQLLTMFSARQYSISFCSTALKAKYSDSLAELGITEVEIKLNHSSFDELVKELNPDMVLFDRFMVEEQFGWRVSEVAPDAVRILNTEDLHSLRDYRQNCHKKAVSFTIADWLDQDKTKREIASIYRSDLTLLVSSFEMELLQKEVRIDSRLLMHLPFLLNEIDILQSDSWPSFDARTDFITFGNGKHAPNVDSIIHLKKTIWPLIRKQLPKTNLHIYGAYLPESVVQLHNEKEGFLVHGWVDDLATEVKKARVVLAPLRFGAGIKGKLSLAMQCGTPNVTTELGAEGMADSMHWAGEIANDPKDFARLAVELYSDESTWSKMQAQGIQIINSLYAKDKLQTPFFERLVGLKKELRTHRNKNYIGALLQHQQMAATKYMGKWIEEKNTKK